MFVVPALLWFGCVLALSLAAYSRDADAKLLALSLGGLWLCAMASWACDVLWLIAVLDYVIAVFALVIAVTRLAGWATAFLTVSVARLLIHVAYALGGGSVEIFAHFLNAAFALQLILVSQPGSRRLASHYSDPVVRRLRSVRSVLSAAASSVTRNG